VFVSNSRAGFHQPRSAVVISRCRRGAARYPPTIGEANDELPGGKAKTRNRGPPQGLPLEGVRIVRFYDRASGPGGAAATQLLAAVLRRRSQGGGRSST